MVDSIDGLDDLWRSYVATLNCPSCDSDSMFIRWSVNSTEEPQKYYWRFTCRDCNTLWYDPQKGPRKTYVPKRD